MLIWGFWTRFKHCAFQRKTPQNFQNFKRYIFCKGDVQITTLFFNKIVHAMEINTYIFIITCNENACLIFYSFASCVGGVYCSITCPTTPYPCSNHQLEIPGFHRVDIFSGRKPREFQALNVRIDRVIVIWANNYISTNAFLNSSKRMNGL